MPPQNKNPINTNDSLEFNPSEVVFGQASPSAGANPVVYPAATASASKPARRLKRLPITILVLVALFVIATPFFIRFLLNSNQSAQTTEEIGSLYPRTSIPLEDFITGAGVDFSNQSVTINGTLQANNGLVLSPMDEPVNPVAGQMYFDQTSNVLAYYDGTSFIPVVGGDAEITTTSINGQTGDITLGPGLVMADGTISNTGVTSLQGATGAVSLVPGTGVTMDGLTINNTGVTSFQGQSGDVTLNAGNGISITGTTISSNGVTNILSGSPNVTITDSGEGVKTISVSTSSGGGNVTTSGGTVGAIPLFTSSENIEDSAITQSGMTITITGDLSVSAGGLSLANALTVSNGGTGTTSLTANGVLIGNGTSPISSVSTATPNLCLLSTAGAPTWGACPGTGDVTSVNGQTGAVNIANASGAGGTVTIDNASNSAKGIASFSSTNFSVTSGAVNTIQDINTGATPTFAGINTSVINPTGTLNVNGELTVQGSALTVGTGALQGGIDIYDANGNRASLITATNLLTDITYTLPVPSGAATSAEICLSTGNCSGAGAAITGNGTAGRLAVFDAAQNITDSSIAESGSSISVLDAITDFSLQGGGLSIGSTTAAGTIALYSNNGNAITINAASALSGNYTYTLPDAGVNAEICLNTGNCIGGGGGGAPADAQYLVLATDADLTNERAISIGANLSAADGGAGGNYTIATVQNPTFTTSVTTPTLQSSGALNITSASGLTITPGGGTAIIDGDLNLTTGNQYQINGTQISSSALSNDSNLAKLNQSQTFTGNNNTFQNVANSTNAFSVQNAAGDSIFAVDSTNSQIVLGTSQASNGTIVFNDISSLNNITLEPVNLTGNHTIQLPDESGVICLDTGNCAGAGATLQTAYNFSTGGTTPKIKVNDTLLGVDIQDANVSIGDSLFTVRASNGSGLGQAMFDVQSSGQVTLQNATNSTTAFRVLTQGGTNILSTDTTNGRIILGQGGVSTGQIVFSHNSGAFTGSLVQGGLTANQTYTLPDSSGTVCLNSGNCAGQGGYVTVAAGQGTTGTIPIFTGTDEIGDSIITQSAGTVQVGGNLRSSGHLAVGANSNVSTNTLISMDETFTSGTISGVDGIIRLNPGASDGNYHTGLKFQLQTDSGNAQDFTGGLRGATIFTQHNGTGTLNEAWGAELRVDNTSTGTLGSAVALRVESNNNSGGGTITNNYGLYINSQTAGSSNYALYTNTGTVRFGDVVQAQTLGTADNNTYLCRNSQNQIATCNTSGAGTSFVQGGNSFGATATLGTNDSNSLQIETNGTTQATIAVGGATTFQNSTNSTGAFRVLNSSAVPQFQIDTTNSRVYIGNPTADATGALLVLDTKNTAGDPTGVNGGMYYNSSSGKFRCFENSAWANCIGGGSDGVAFTSSGTFSKASYPGMKGIFVEGVGGGGGGGGAYITTGSADAWIGGGGGAGGYFKRYIPEASLAASETVTVGTGGAGGTGSIPFGVAGTATSFGSFCTANGGARGSHVFASSVRITSSDGGTATGTGCLVIKGGASIPAMKNDGYLTSAGIGGRSQLSGQPITSAGYHFGASGTAGIAYGGGGNGAWNPSNSGSSFSGGNGADGIVTITIVY